MTDQSGRREGGLRWLYAVAQSSTLLGLAMIGLIWMSLAFHSGIERDTAEHAAIENSRNLARAFEAHVSQSLNDINRTLDVMRAYYQRDPDHPDLRVWNESTKLLERDLMQISIVGPDGYVRASSNPNWTRVYVGDREHFRALVEATDDKMVISKPVVGRISRRTAIQLARRISRPDGSFDGIITASLDPSYFARLYDSVEVGADGFIRVVGLDGVIRAAGGNAREEPGRDLRGARLFELVAKQPAGWFYTESRFKDQIPRLLVYRSVKDFPLLITVGRSTREIFAPLNTKRRSYNIIAALLTMLILA